MRNIKKSLSLLACTILSLAVAFNSFADETPVENLYHYTLDNGLTLFVNENSSVPLVYIEIAVRAGAVTQTPETAGLFHLYEHMMFKGNELYSDASSVQKAIKDLGVSSWNGTTSTDYVNYFFTIPSSQLENGLAFWNAAVRTPLMNPSELETEKKVVLSEIEGSASDPGSIYYDYVNATMFPEAPYRADAGGSFDVVRNATVAQMRDIQAHYYIPCNSALFVGGDVKAEEVLELVNAIYGDWSNNGNSVPEKQQQQNVNPFDQVEYCVMPYDQISPVYAQVEISFRGPDADFDIEDTYPADVLVNFLGDPDGYFANELVANENLGIPDVDYVWSSYGTSRASSTFDFSAIMLSPEVQFTDRVDMLLSQIQEDILPEYASDASLYSKKQMESLVKSIEEDRIMNSESAENLLSDLRFWWASTTADYYFNYTDNLGKVTVEDLQNFYVKYFMNKKPLVSIIINPDVFEANRDEYIAKGYTVVTDTDKTWWKQSQFQSDPEKVAKEVSVPEQTNPVYRPTGKYSSESSSEENTVVSYRLSNGIPVYVQSNPSAKVDSVAIGVKGGVMHMTEATSGLEAALFSMMAKSSSKYSLSQRQSLNYDKGISVGSMTKLSGSALLVNTLDSYFDEALAVLTDGFLNPSYDKDVYNNYMNDVVESLQSMLNDPSELLMYQIQNDVYENHPYAVRQDATPLSYQNITIPAMKELHKTILNPAEIYVVAVGNIDGAKLVKTLNKTLGKIKKVKNYQSKTSEVPPVQIQEKAPVVLTNDSVSGSGYVARIFAAPANTSDEYISASIAADIYSDILYNVVREKYGACYTPYSYTVGSKAPYGMEFLYSLSDFASFPEYMEESRNYMKNDQVIEAVNEDGSFVFSTIEDRLESYRNSYITGTYDSQSSSLGVLKNLTYNVMQYGDINYDKTELELLDSLTAEQVLASFNRYWVDSPAAWYVITGEDDVQKLPADFQ